MNKNHFIKALLWAAFGIFIPVFLLIILPELNYELQVKNVVSSEINTDKIYDRSKNNTTRQFLQHNKDLKIISISDFQGSNGKEGYFVVELNKGRSLGVMCSFHSVGPYIWAVNILSVQLNT
ncbi:hypothetical protein [Companilactobacillus mishanensis]|uniref:DUF1310 family protein n=2 Tax=Companilactobacillus mishanensis TaxID=2486008 RepID=A0ABW9P8W3_9LACO|nr:hypothetical protein [Companilactobacillus mishanensis]MQS45601.1 hypothetical protein [Companilactobacillus mishanensis]